jgi:hypothetical protein
VQERVIGAIQMQIAFVHFLPGSVENLNAANGGFNILRKLDSNFLRRCLDRAAYGWLRTLKKSMCFKARSPRKKN